MKKLGSGPRVYEYVADDGTTYYTFTRSPSTITPPTRMVLQSRLGVHYSHFLVKMRQLAELLRKDDEGEG